MGRRNETNRLTHKKKFENKKRKESDAELLRKEKLKAILKLKNEKEADQ